MNTNLKITASLITFLIIATIRPVMSAAHISQSDTGQAMIIPFYSINNTLQSLTSVNNTTDQGKAIKIHFREAKSGDIIVSFNVYLAAKDMWTMVAGAVDGDLKMTSSDSSCRFNFPQIEFNQDLPLLDPNWTSNTGYIEIIEMGTLNFDPLDRDRHFFYCHQETYSRWDEDGIWSNDSTADMSPPSGGLRVQSTLQSYEAGYSINLPVIHIDGFFDPGSEIMHTEPSSPLPDLSSGSHKSMVLHNGELIETTWPTGYEAVSAVLTQNSITNEFNLEKGVAAKTNWIFSFPTLHYHLNSSEGSAPFKTANDQVMFPNHFDDNMRFFNREAIEDSYYCMTTCAPYAGGLIDHSVVNYVLENQFDQTYVLNPLLTLDDAENTYPIKVINHSWTDMFDFQNGKITMQLGPERQYSTVNNRGHDSNNPNIIHEFHGLPVIGFSVTQFTNANAQPNIFAQYAFLREHFGEKKIVIGDQQ